MNELFNWDGIAVPQSNFNVRKLAVKCHHDLFIGKNEFGKKLFVICLKGDQASAFKKYRVTISGLDIDLRQDDDDKQNIIITLDKQTDEDIFSLLINSIIFSINTNLDSSKVVYNVFKSINRWKLFLANRKTHILTSSQIRGLYAELSFLKALLSKVGIEDYLNILDSWKGPEKTQHDFIFNNIAVEIKSLNGDERSTVRISSEDQLESNYKKLYLKIYVLGESEDEKTSLSLNQLVESIVSLLDSYELENIFYSKICLAGYLPLEEYSKPKFFITNEKTFSVIDDFPRLTKNNLPFGIVRTNYEILLSEISRFEITNDIIWSS
ncbi:PD-(D/E)XK motif protein [Rahnella sp. Lac-M11]|uniref:PD-(D/E)XK motif protein n=1 Tax=Rahnella contaminans TaxID=2703882 RepID=A0A6M2B4P2_9GAMM|nr:PD-(D/E)XK motif protein [Rahnella contaminans]NGX87414.1 PD-(D/E)XK motif protein [Rahnella contaminans]